MELTSLGQAANQNLEATRLYQQRASERTQQEPQIKAVDQSQTNQTAPHENPREAASVTRVTLSAEGLAKAAEETRNTASAGGTPTNNAGGSSSTSQAEQVQQQRYAEQRAQSLQMRREILQQNRQDAPAYAQSGFSSQGMVKI